MSNAKQVTIFIDGEFLMTVLDRHVDSALDQLDFEFDIADTTFAPEGIYLTTAENNSQDF